MCPVSNHVYGKDMLSLLPLPLQGPHPWLGMCWFLLSPKPQERWTSAQDSVASSLEEEPSDSLPLAALDPSHDASSTF